MNDVDGDATTITYENGPAWLAFTSPTTSNGSAITAAQAGNWSVAMKVCDTWNACSVSSYVLWINQVPVINAGIPAVTCIQGHACTY